MSVKPLALSVGEARRSPPAAPSVSPGGERLWVAVLLPELALQAVESAASSPSLDARQGDPRSRQDLRPTVVVEATSGRLRVVAANEAAQSRGIRLGLDLNAAFAFSGALRVLERSRRAERSLLEALAAICRRFTPTVSLELPESVLLEVRASLNLFGGVERLEAMLREALTSRVAGSRLVFAPTPLAALWLARGGGGHVFSRDGLLFELSRLPLRVTRWPEGVLDRLEGMGVATIGEVLRLSRDGFARRVGDHYLASLDKALGKRPDLRTGFEPPQHLGFEIELVDESTSLPVFVDAASRMIEHLTRELRLRQAQIGKMQLVFRHARAMPSVYRLELLESTCDGRRLLELLRDKLERLVLPAPAIALSLMAGPLEPAAPRAGRLFKGEGEADGGEARVRLVERLRGRLGEPAVHGLAAAPDHRPERAWIRTAPFEKPDQTRATAVGASSERPLWFVPVPEPLRADAGRPLLDGAPLRVLEGPERIESGWWDGEGIARDYFVALGANGERLWIFRDRAEHRWYLHGRFG